MSNVVKKTETQAVVPAEYMDIQWEDDGSEDIQIRFPSVVLTQATSKTPDAGRHGGDFWHSDREEYTRNLECVALRMSYQQAFFEDGKTAPSCSAQDGKVPRPGQSLWQQETYKPRNMPEQAVPLMRQPSSCAECPFSQFGPNGERPLCNKSVLLLIERLDDGSYAQLRFGGMSLKPWEKFVSSKLQHKNRRVPLFTNKLTLTGREESRDQNKWYELEVYGEVLPIEEQQRYNALVGSMRSHMEQAIAESEQAMDMPAPAAAPVAWDDGLTPLKQSAFIEPDLD